MTQVSLGELKQSPLTQIISLGPKCAVAHNVRRFFDIGTAMPFDWWITPPGSIARILSDRDVGKIYDPQQLFLNHHPVHPSVVHRDYGIMLHHEFPRHKTEANQPVVADFIDHIEVPKTRTEYLFKRFLALNRPAERILFVRQGELQDGDVEVLAKLFDQALWSYAIIPEFEAEGFDWKSDPDRWDAALGNLGVDFDRSRHKPFQDRGAQHHYDDVFATGPA